MRLLAVLLAATGPAGAAALSYVGHAVSSRLAAPDLASQRGKTWDLSNSTLEPDWLLVSPPQQLGRSTASLPVAKECTVSDGVRCNAEFGLFRCVAGSDCEPAFAGGAIPECLPVQSTVAAPGAEPEQLCVGHSHNLYERVYAAIVRTERVLDLSSLSAPDGRFLAACRNALTVLSLKPQPIEVRVMIGYANIMPKTDIGGCEWSLPAHRAQRCCCCFRQLLSSALSSAAFVSWGLTSCPHGPAPATFYRRSCRRPAKLPRCGDA